MQDGAGYLRRMSQAARADDAPIMDLRAICLLVDDDRLRLGAHEQSLGAAGVPLLGTARSGVEALLLLDGLPVTVIVVPVGLPDLAGQAFVRRAFEIARQKFRVLVAAEQPGTEVVHCALDAGAHGIFLDDGLSSSVTQALSAVAAGRVFVDPRLRQSP
jgi:DNA-binding NarL/FixJ family response regulator